MWVAVGWLGLQWVFVSELGCEGVESFYGEVLLLWMDVGLLWRGRAVAVLLLIRFLLQCCCVCCSCYGEVNCGGEWAVAAGVDDEFLVSRRGRLLCCCCC